MAAKKTELYSKLWASCDELRGGMDASQYKDYVLVLLFIKYVSDRYAESLCENSASRSPANDDDEATASDCPEQFRHSQHCHHSL
jgi:type I restriction-modification system DNA methylase subunit